jgi:hypothetical protein
MSLYDGALRLARRRRPRIERRQRRINREMPPTIPPMRPPWVEERVEGRADEADVEDSALEAEESEIEE